MFWALLVAGLVAYVCFGLGVVDELELHGEVERLRRVSLIALWPFAFAFVGGIALARWSLSRIGVDQDDAEDDDEPPPSSDDPDELDPPDPMPWRLQELPRKREIDRPN